MRASRMNLVTLREDPSEAEIASHRLLTRAVMELVAGGEGSAARAVDSG
jgi:prolyl-tRNA synthetase